MVTFARGGGVEFIPLIDQQNIRKAFLDRVTRDNRLDMRDDAMIHALVHDGRLLLYLRPTGNPNFPYQIHDYPPTAYRAYYDGSGALESVKMMWSYKLVDREQLRDRWVLLRLTAQTVEKIESWQMPNLDQILGEGGGVLTEMGGDYSTSPNSLGYLSCVEVKNVSPVTGREGVSDFEKLGSKIVELDDLSWAMNENVYFFCTSPLETSRSAAEVTEVAPQFSRADDVSYAAGFRDVGSPRPVRDRARLKRVLGDFDPAAGDYIRQISMNALPGDQVRYVEGLERTLREALGGILERGIETATETNAVYGKAISNARKKQLALFKYGLGSILEMAIRTEELKYLASKGKEGLPDLGDRTITYRVAPVFMESPNEINLRSITGRNMAKYFGVSNKYALKYVHPNRSDAEISLMLDDGGFPSEYLQSAIAMYRDISQLIDPMTGMTPVDPATGQPLASLLLPFISENLIYGRDNANIDASREPIPDPNAALAAAIVNWKRTQSGGKLVPSNDQQPADAPDAQLSIPTSGTTVRAPFLDFSRSPIANGARALGGAIGGLFSR
jgi:hypothetical protein